MLRRLAALQLLVSVLGGGVVHAAPLPRVVVLELAKDSRGALREQVLDALTEAKQVELVPLRKWEDLADRKRIHPKKYTDPYTIRTLAPALELRIVIAGEVADRFTIRIFDATGEQVWTKDLPLVRGKLSAENARRLAAAIAVASEPQPSGTAGATTGGTRTGTTTGTGTAPPDTTGTGSTTTGTTSTTGTTPGTGDSTTGATTGATTGTDAGGATGTSGTATAAGQAPPPTTNTAPAFGPPMFAGRVSGSTTWRYYCSRPGVNSCKQWDDLPDGTEPTGETVTFTSAIPYSGYALTGEVFPFARADAWWNGFGLHGEFAQAFSLTTLRVSTPNSSIPDRTVLSVDLAYSGDALYRWYFGLGGFPGFVGARAGYRGHEFTVEPGTLLRGSHRRFFEFGAEAKLPLAKLAQVELGGTFFLTPRPSADELSKYGTSARSFGFGADLGLTGEVWGPLGYVVRFHLEYYSDKFIGAGTVWTNGGVALETYATAFWGMTAAF